MPAVKPAVRDELVLTESEDGEALVFDPATGGVHHLNAEAALVYGLCDGTASVHDTAVEIAEELGLSAKSVEKQVRTLVRDLNRNGLLASRRRKPAPPDVDGRELVRIHVPHST